MRAWTSPEPIRVGTVKAYLFMIARNLYRAGLRQRTRHVGLNEALRDPARNPEAIASERHELHRVSNDSRRLIDEFLAGDPDFARALWENGTLLTTTAPVDLPPNLEAETLNRTKRQLLRKSPFRILAVALTGLAIARIVSDTTFTASPRRFVATAIAAIICWVLYAWHTRRLRLVGLPKPGRR